MPKTNPVKQAPQESLVRIFLNGKFLASLLCTPKHVKELAVGWLFNQGLVASINDIASLGACDDLKDIHVHLVNGKEATAGWDPSIRTSACMGGEIPVNRFLGEVPTLTGGPTVSLQLLKTLMREALSRASSYRETGGIHCAAVGSAVEERILSMFEDVGRHNAFDKVMGRMLLGQTPPHDKLILTSGRISSEMVLKLAHGRIPIAASITTITDLAVRIAENAGLTLVGRVLHSSPVIWCGHERIKRGS